MSSVARKKSSACREDRTEVNEGRRQRADPPGWFVCCRQLKAKTRCPDAPHSAVSNFDDVVGKMEQNHRDNGEKREKRE